MVGALVAVTQLSGCGSDSVTLSARPTNLSSARDLAQLVASTAKCGSFEDYSQHADYWTFTCQTGDHSYEIRAVNGTGARQAAVRALSGTPAIKAGSFFLVTETPLEGRTAAPADLAAFPGELQSPAPS